MSGYYEDSLVNRPQTGQGRDSVIDKKSGPVSSDKRNPLAYWRRWY